MGVSDLGSTDMRLYGVIGDIAVYQWPGIPGTRRLFVGRKISQGSEMARRKRGQEYHPLCTAIQEIHSKCKLGCCDIIRDAKLSKVEAN
jgi:hypothetical protein